MKTMQKNLISMVVAGLLIPLTAQADIEEIIVTANKREQSIQDVPIAISAFDSSALAEIGADSLENLTNFVPGVALFDDRGAGQPTWVIRGVGLADFNANNTPTAAIYYDEAYMTSNALGAIGLYDIERVEVLKGPQGGLYGRNTTGGAVRIVSNRPNLAESEGYVSVSYEGRYGGTVAEAAYNVPLSENAAVRVAMQGDHGGGWQDSLATAEDDDHGDRDSLAFRGQLLYSPSDDLEILFKADIGRDKSETMLGRGNGFYDPLTGGPCAAIMAGQRDETSCIGLHNLLGDPRLPSDQTKNGSVVLSNPINDLDNEWTGITLTVDKDLGYASLVSISSFLDFDYVQSFDYDGTPLALVQSKEGFKDHDTTIEQWSQEFRLLSNNDGPLSWLAGANYAKDTNDTMTSADITTLYQIGYVPFDLVTNSYSQETSTWAVYGQAGYDISDSVNINGSLRYTDEDKELDYTTYIGAEGVLMLLGDVQGMSSSLDSNWSGHLGIDWRVSDNTLVYAKYSRGFKSGGFFTAWTDDTSAIPVYKEEVNDAYEVGVKSNPSDELQVNAAVYFYDYQDTQGKISAPSAAAPSGYLTALGTLGDAEHTGAEVDLLWSPAQMPGFSVQLAYAWLDAEITSSDYVSFDQLSMVYSLEGLDRDFAPKTSYSVNVRQEANVTESLLGSVSAAYSWRDDPISRSMQVSDKDCAVYCQDSYGHLNLRIALAHLNQGWEVALLGENVTDETYITIATGDDGGNYMDMPARPASWSVQLQYDF